jgi:histidinol-phosphatase (PHP family)
MNKVERRQTMRNNSINPADEDVRAPGKNTIPVDYHMHTILCKHAKGDVSDYVDAARKKGIPEICFTDHAPAPDGYDATNRMELSQFPEYQQLVAKVRDSQNPTVLFGIEADYYEGCEEFLRKWLPKQKFDLVLGSIHYIGKWGFDNPDDVKTWETTDVTGAWREYFKLVARLADTGMYDVLSHPDLPKKFGFSPSEKQQKEMVQPALDRIAAAGMAIELNTSGLRRPVKEIYPSPMILQLAQEREIPITFGSDAHMPSDVGSAFAQALALAKECGYTRCVRFRRREKQIVKL